MDRNGRRPRRLCVSALAAVANPSYSRIDTWNLLDDACHHLAVIDRAGMDTSHEAARVRRLLNRLSAYERYWIYPGPENLATYCGYLDQLATVSLAEQVSLAVRLLSEYGDRAALFDTSSSLADQELVSRAKEQQFYTVLLADDAPVTAPEGLAESLRAIRNVGDDVQFELLVVTSVEDAITAVALNGEIQAAIIRHDIPLRSHDRVPLMTTLLGRNDDVVATDRTHDWVECGEWIRELRPHIDLYPAHRRVDRRRGRGPVRRLRPHLLSAQRRHRPAHHRARRYQEPLLHTVFRRAAGLRGTAGRPIPRAAHRARRQHLQLQDAAGHGRVLRPQHLHGRDVDHLRWTGLAAGPTRQHQESDGQGRAHLELRPDLLRHQRNVDREQDRRAVADPAR